MNTFFSGHAEKQLRENLYSKPLSFMFSPYKNPQDFSLTLISVFFLPIYDLFLTLLILIETVILSIAVFYYHSTNKEDNCAQSMEKCKKSAEINLKILLATIFVALCMLIIFLFRLIATVASMFSQLHNLKNSQANRALQVKMEREALSNYNKLLREATEDTDFITKILKEINSQSEQRIENIAKLCKEREKTYKKIINESRSYYISMCAEDEDHVSFNKQNNISNNELLSALQKLLLDHPADPKFNALSTVCDIEIAYQKLEEHHKKTVELASILLTNLNATSNCATNNLAEKFRFK